MEKEFLTLPEFLYGKNTKKCKDAEKQLLILRNKIKLGLYPKIQAPDPTKNNVIKIDFRKC